MIESFCYTELGLKPKDYYRLTMRQYLLMQEGFKRKLDNDKLIAIDNWRRTRFIAYLLARDSLKDKNTTIYEFYPLPDDPTKEELEKARKEQEEKDGTWMKSVINLFRSKKKKV